MRIPLTPHGIPEILFFALMFLGGGAVGLIWVGGAAGAVLAVLGAACFGFVLNFFRDPERTLPQPADQLVSPADGTVTDVLELPAHDFVGAPCVRIGIFLSVFDVHVNRLPLHGVVCHREHRPGRFLDARDPAGSDLNEALDLGIEVSTPRRRCRVLVRQIAGAIARRIVCPMEVGGRCERGARYGMIKFGSRAEVYLPRDLVAQVLVAPGDKVKGGSTALATLTETPQ